MTVRIENVIENLLNPPLVRQEPKVCVLFRKLFMPRAPSQEICDLDSDLLSYKALIRPPKLF